MKSIPSNIIISRTDSIGDVVLTLPMAAVLKTHFPSVRICFMGKAYTRPVIEACTWVDEFIDLADFMNKPLLIDGKPPECIIHVFPTRPIAKRARQLGIPLRIGTSSRLYHWGSCNKLVRLSRKNSDLHEAQLNLVLLKPFGIEESYTLQALGSMTGLEKIPALQPRFQALLNNGKYNLILHPKSQGNGREWPLERYIELIKLLPPDDYSIFISGTSKEREALQPLLEAVGDRVTDIVGEMSLPEFMAFIKASDGLVASGTGPIHLAAALGIDAFGIYPPIRPVHPGRWAPLGPRVRVLVQAQRCTDCDGDPGKCHCMSDISATVVQQAIEEQKLVPGS